MWAGTNRGIFAIVFTDIVDSTGLRIRVGDSSSTLVIEKHITRTPRLIDLHNGCFVKFTGDGVLAIFHTAGEALGFSLAVTRDTGEPSIKLRVGIHIGEVELSPDDIKGTAVDMAKRLQEKAPHFGIMVSDRAHGDIEQAARKGHRELPWKNEGECELKGLGASKLWSVSVTVD